MANRRNVMLGLATGISGLTAMSRAKAAGASVSLEDAKAAINAFLAALHTGDTAKVDEVLAPSFQIMRSDGSSFDRAGYLKALPKTKVLSTISDVKITGDDETFVASYISKSDQTINGKRVEPTSPRLSVFQKIDDSWLIVAHANFGKIG